MGDGEQPHMTEGFDVSAMTRTLDGAVRSGGLEQDVALAVYDEYVAGLSDDELNDLQASLAETRALQNQMWDRTVAQRIGRTGINQMVLPVELY